MDFWSGRECAGTEKSPACTGWKQRGSCRCEKETCRDEGRLEADTGAEDATAKQGGITGKKSTLAAEIDKKSNSTTDGKVLSADTEPTVDLNATSWSFTCEHPG
eukprot:2965931-Rhodomonas_salina.1